MIANFLAATNAIPDITDVPSIQDIGAGFRDISTFFSSFLLRMQAELLSGTIWLQLGGIIVALFLGFVFTRILKAATGGFFADLAESFRGGKYEAVSATLVFPLIASGIIWLVIAGFTGRGIPVDYMRIVGAALVATLIIRTFALTSSDPLWPSRWCGGHRFSPGLSKPGSASPSG